MSERSRPRLATARMRGLSLTALAFAEARAQSGAMALCVPLGLPERRLARRLLLRLRRAGYEHASVEMETRNHYFDAEREKFLKRFPSAVEVAVAPGLVEYASTRRKRPALRYEIDAAEILARRQAWWNTIPYLAALPTRRCGGDINLAADRGLILKDWLKWSAARNRPLLVVAEGISYYLSVRAWAELIGGLLRSTSEPSCLLFDHWIPACRESRALSLYRSVLRREFDATPRLRCANTRAFVPRAFALRRSTMSRELALDCFEDTVVDSEAESWLLERYVTASRGW